MLIFFIFWFNWLISFWCSESAQAPCPLGSHWCGKPGTPCFASSAQSQGTPEAQAVWTHTIWSLSRFRNSPRLSTESCCALIEGPMWCAAGSQWSALESLWLSRCTWKAGRTASAPFPGSVSSHLGRQPPWLRFTISQGYDVVTDKWCIDCELFGKC